MEHFEDENKLPCIGELTDFSNLCNMPVNYIKRIVQFCKKITAFTCLTNVDDQKLILKPYFMEFLCLRFTFLFDVANDGHMILAVCENSLHYISNLSIIILHLFHRMKMENIHIL